jgi:hypothetical protein
MFRVDLIYAGVGMASDAVGVFRHQYINCFLFAIRPLVAICTSIIIGADMPVDSARYGDMAGKTILAGCRFMPVLPAFRV